jgi:outer membrane protein assembly factor BamB
MKGQKRQGDHPFSADSVDEQIDRINKSITAHSLQNDDDVKATQQPDQHVNMQESSFISPDQRLVNGLQSLYTEETSRQIGERAWQRLQQQGDANIALYKPNTGMLSTEQPVHNKQSTRKGITMLNDTLVKPEIDRSRPVPISRGKRYASLLTAAVVALCIVGSLFWVLNAAHQSTRTGGNHTNTVPNTKAKSQVESPEGVYIGGIHGVYRLDVKTGATLWNFTPPNNPSAPSQYQEDFTSRPIVDGKDVYVGVESGILYALDAETGKLVWKHDFGQHFLVITAIQDASSTLYVRVDTVQSTVDNYLYELNSTDGTVKTRMQLDVHSSVTIIQDKLYIVLTNDLYVRELATGKLIWHASIDATQALNTDPEVVNGITYLTSSSLKIQNGRPITDYTSYIYAFDSQTGKLLWRSGPKDGVINDAPVIYNGVMYSTIDNTIYAMYTDTGKEWWHQQEPAGIDQGTFEVVIAPALQEENGILYAQVNQMGVINGSEVDGNSTNTYTILLGFKPDGTIVLQKKLADFLATQSTFVVQNGVAYIGGFDQVNAYSTADGGLLWKGQPNLNTTSFALLTVVS